LWKMRPKIYLYGDSITEESFGDGGWGASLSHHFSRTVIIHFFLSYYLSYCLCIYIYFLVSVFLDHVWFFIFFSGWCGAKRVQWV
jgi:hypothetical protein